MKFPKIQGFTDWNLEKLIDKLKEEYTEMYAFSLAYKKRENSFVRKEILDSFAAETLDFMQMLNTTAYSLEWRLSKPIINENSIAYNLSHIEKNVEFLDVNNDSYEVFKYLNDMQDLSFSIFNTIIKENNLNEINCFNKHICKLRGRGLKFD